MDDGHPVRRRVSVSGRVQGVFYRAWTQARAEAAGVAGWVRNLPDGRVEAVLEGEPAAVQRLLDAMHHGPPRARVEQVDVRDEPPTGETGFRVR